MRLLNTDGEYGCIASWVRPEVSKGGRKVVLYNVLRGKERELDRDEARILFSMTGDNDPIKDRESLRICDSLWRGEYIEKTCVSEPDIMVLASVMQEEIDEEAGVTAHVKVDETEKYRTELICEEAYTRAIDFYNEKCRTFSKSAHPMLWTILLCVIGALIFAVGPLLPVRALLSGTSYNYWDTFNGLGFFYLEASIIFAFFVEGYLRDICHGFVGRLFGARVIYKGFLNGSWLHGDWYLIDDSMVRGKYGGIQKMHIRLAGAYCDILMAVVLSFVMFHTENTQIYVIISGALFGILIRWLVHIFPLIFVCDDWNIVVDEMLHSRNIIDDLDNYIWMFCNRDTRHELMTQRGVQAVGALLAYVLFWIFIVIGVLAVLSMIIIFIGWVV